MDNNQNRGVVIKAPQFINVKYQKVSFEIEMKNNSHYPYSPGCHLVSVFSQNQKEYFEDVKVPIIDVPAKANFTIDIVLT